MRLTVTALVLLLAAPVQSQDLYSPGACAPATAATFLEVGNVKAQILNNGGLFWDRGSNVYEVPAGGGVNAIHSMSLMIGGIVDGDVRTAASWWSEREFWAGPIPEDGSPPSNCQEFDRFWALDRELDFWREDAPTDPAAPVRDWPVSLGAPFIEQNGEPGYQPGDGDYPEMRGDRQVWWIMNDRGNVHRSSDSLPLGLEVRASAFGFDTDNALGNVTFYRYVIENRGSDPIRDVAVGFFQDMDLGALDDDRIGTDTTLAMLYVFNDSNMDGVKSSGYGYQERPPALGTTILEARHSRGILPTDRGLAPSFHLTMTGGTATGGGPTGDPGKASDFYNLLTARWKDGQPFTEGGYGRDFSSDPMPFWMPGDPLTASFWSELNVDNNGTRQATYDRIANLGFGTFDLLPTEWAQFTMAILWARGDDNMDSLVELRHLAAQIHESKASILAPRTLKPALFEDGNPPDAPEYPFWVDEPYPNPAGNRLTLRSSFDRSGLVSVRVIDALGKTRIVDSIAVSEAGHRDIALDVSALSPGSYSVSVESWSHRTSHPFVVVR